MRDVPPPHCPGQVNKLAVLLGALDGVALSARRARLPPGYDGGHP